MLDYRNRIGVRVTIIAIALAASAASVAEDIEYISNENIVALGPYSPATVLGDLVFTSGQIAFDAEQGAIVGSEIREQTRQVLKNLSAVLDAAGSSIDLVLKTTVFLQNPDDFKAMNEVYAEFFPDKKPARTTVPGANWGGSVLVEIEAIAVRKDSSED